MLSLSATIKRILRHTRQTQAKATVGAAGWRWRFWEVQTEKQGWQAVKHGFPKPSPGKHIEEVDAATTTGPWFIW